MFELYSENKNQQPHKPSCHVSFDTKCAQCWAVQARLPKVSAFPVPLYSRNSPTEELQRNIKKPKTSFPNHLTKLSKIFKPNKAHQSSRLQSSLLTLTNNFSFHLATMPKTAPSSATSKPAEPSARPCRPPSGPTAATSSSSTTSRR